MRKKSSRVISVMLIIVAAGILIPILVILVWVFTERWAWPDFKPQVFSMRALQDILGRSNQIVPLFLSSIGISSAAAAISVAISIMTARAFVFYEFKGKRLLHFLSFLPFMVPATVFAMGIQVSFIKAGLNNTVWGVIIVHVVYSLPYGIRLLTEGTRGIGQGLEEQARILGASAMKAFYKVSLPLLIPVILSAFSMSYIVSFSQYFLTLLIGGGQVKTFTIVMVPYLQSGDRNVAAVYSVLFLGVTLIVFGLFDWTAQRLSRNHRINYYE